MGLLQTALSNSLNMHFDGKLCNKESVRKMFLCSLYIMQNNVCVLIRSNYVVYITIQGD